MDGWMAQFRLARVLISSAGSSVPQTTASRAQEEREGPANRWVPLTVLRRPQPLRSVDHMLALIGLSRAQIECDPGILVMDATCNGVGDLHYVQIWTLLVCVTTAIERCTC